MKNIIIMSVFFSSDMIWYTNVYARQHCICEKTWQLPIFDHAI